MTLFDWHQLRDDEATAVAVIDSRRRLRICLIGFVALLALVFGRVVHLEVTQGAAFRSEAARPLSRHRNLPGVRGRILARDGTVLAYDKEILALAVHYRYLQEPPDADWLRRKARAQLTGRQRKDPQRIAAEEAKVRARRVELAERLSALCGLSAQQWSSRARRIQARVERIAESVNRRRLGASSADQPSSPMLEGIGRLLPVAGDASSADSAPARITVADELDYHVMVEGLPLAVVAEIDSAAEQYVGVRILHRTRRAYPSGQLAAHVLGHLGAVQPNELGAGRGKATAHLAGDFVGRMGVERQYEGLLRGHSGVVVELTDHGGGVLSTHRRREPAVGGDLRLTLDAPLQRAAESLLDGALRRRRLRAESTEPAGGAIVVMDVHSGALRVAASVPRFDPNWFVQGKSDEIAALLKQADHPLFDRVCCMAIPPGSVFKTVSAMALLEAAVIDPQQAFVCRGYLHQPDRQRCAIYRRRGIGHGEIALADALAQSCNVYFFHHVGKLGPTPLVDWALRLGFGRPTGVDLPGEAAGMVPTPVTIRDLEGHAWRPGDAQALAVGQGSLTATPLQVVRMMAAVANGGRLVTPYVAEEPYRQPSPDSTQAEIPDGLLRHVRAGLKRVVADPKGTAHGTVYIETVEIAGKTGTAETGADRAAHAWFAGYAPADRPRLAFVVVLEHAGDAATAAGPVAKRMVLRMQQLGLL